MRAGEEHGPYPLTEISPQATALVLGSGDVGSAVAHVLHIAGFAVTVHEEKRPAHHRRGMALCDVFWDGQADLAGVQAKLRGGEEAAPQRFDGRAGVAAALGPLQQWLRIVPWDVLVDARMRKRDTPPDHRSAARLAIGLGPGFVPGLNCHVAVETSWEDLGRVVERGPTLALRGEPRPIAGAGRERTVRAPVDGVFCTEREIGGHVAAGDVVGWIGRIHLVAPMAGVLRGLTRDGAEVRRGTKVIEIDPRGDPALCFGLGERPRKIAMGVLQALRAHELLRFHELRASHEDRSRPE